MEEIPIRLDAKPTEKTICEICQIGKLRLIDDQDLHCCKSKMLIGHQYRYGCEECHQLWDYFEPRFFMA